MKSKTPFYHFLFFFYLADNELKELGDYCATAFRQYGPGIGRWFRVDPMAEKYPQWSPPVFVLNNPVYYIDHGGGEGVGGGDHKNKTITIKAVYFIEVGRSGFSTESYKQPQGFNTVLKSKGYTVTDRNDSLKGYSVQFDLQFIPVNFEKTHKTSQ